MALGLRRDLLTHDGVSEFRWRRGEAGGAAVSNHRPVRKGWHVLKGPMKAPQKSQNVNLMKALRIPPATPPHPTPPPQLSI